MKLPPRCDRAWFIATFCAGRDDPGRGGGDAVWDRVDYPNPNPNPDPDPNPNPTPNPNPNPNPTLTTTLTLTLTPH